MAGNGNDDEINKDDNFNDAGDKDDNFNDDVDKQEQPNDDNNDNNDDGFNDGVEKNADDENAVKYYNDYNDIVDGDDASNGDDKAEDDGTNDDENAVKYYNNYNDAVDGDDAANFEDDGNKDDDNTVNYYDNDIVDGDEAAYGDDKANAEDDGTNDDGAGNDSVNGDYAGDGDDAVNAVFNNSNNDDIYYQSYKVETNINNTNLISFDSYQVTTVNPGIQLLAVTLFVCFICFTVGFFTMPGGFLNNTIYQKFKRREKREADDDSVEMKSFDAEDSDSCYYKDMNIEDYTKDLLMNKTGARLSTGNSKVPDTLWKESIDKETGEPFYFNTETLESTWVKPERMERPASRLSMVRQKRFSAQKKNIVFKERAYMQTMGRQRSIVRRKVGRRAMEEANILRWADFRRIFEFTGHRPNSAPGRIQEDTYKTFVDNMHEDDNSVSTTQEESMNKRVWKETKKIIGLGTP